MNPNERSIIAVVLALVTMLVSIDIYTDSQEGVVFWHLAIESLIGLASLFGIFLLVRGTFTLKRRLNMEIENFSAYKQDADAWRRKSKKYIDGLALAIDQQLTKWHLTAAEKEVAFLLLKGFSLKEISNIRNTSEKTARVQSTSIYTKSGLSGRSELSAFFLEDLLMPTRQTNDEVKPVIH